LAGLTWVSKSANTQKITLGRGRILQAQHISPVKPLLQVWIDVCPLLGEDNTNGLWIG
jgi:hypothetical protein